MARPSKHDGSIYPRKDGKVLMDGLSRPERKAYPGINEHGRLAGGPAEIAGSPPGQGRQDPRYRPERRTTTIRGLGGLFPGELLQAADPRRKDPRSERACRPRTSRRRLASVRLATSRADDIEHYLRRRLQARVQVKTAAGVIQKDRLKPATVHQELRVLRRMMNVAVRKKLLPANPCAGVEFPVKVKGLFRPHYMSWSEQQRIEFQGARVFAQHHPDHHGIRTPGVQGTDADEEGAGGSGERGGLDSGFEDAERNRRGSPDGSGSSKRFASRFESRDREPGCSRATRIRQGIRRR